jgi:hypothetical protein
MVDTKLVAISYCLIFLFILFCAVGYIVIPTYVNKAFHKNIDLPKTAVMTNSITAVSAIPTNNLMWLALIIIAVIIILFVMGSFSMMSAY